MVIQSNQAYRMNKRRVLWNLLREDGTGRYSSLSERETLRPVVRMTTEPSAKSSTTEPTTKSTTAAETTTVESKARWEATATAEQVCKVDALAFVIVFAQVVSPAFLWIGQNTVGFNNEFELLFVAALNDEGL